MSGKASTPPAPRAKAFVVTLTIDADAFFKPGFEQALEHELREVRQAVLAERVKRDKERELTT